MSAYGDGSHFGIGKAGQMRYLQRMRERFDSIYAHGFIRAAVCVPSLRVADPEFNVERTVALADSASKQNVAVALFPELGLSAYSNEDSFHQDALLEATKHAPRG